VLQCSCQRPAAQHEPDDRSSALRERRGREKAHIGAPDDFSAAR
jgi:hypothetical protein